MIPKMLSLHILKIVNFVGRRFVCLMVLSGLLFLAPNRSVKANAPTLSTYARFDFHPYWDGLTSGQLQPYTAAYMTTDYLSGSPEWGAAFAFKVTVSLAGTNRAVIQADNVLAAGIAAQGPHKVKPPWIDWGYLLLLVVDGVESEPYIQGAVWKGYEWGRNALFPYETPVADLVSQWTWRYPGVLTINSDVTLEMAWNNSTETLN